MRMEILTHDYPESLWSPKEDDERRRTSLRLASVGVHRVAVLGLRQQQKNCLINAHSETC